MLVLRAHSRQQAIAKNHERSRRLVRHSLLTNSTKKLDHFFLPEGGKKIKNEKQVLVC